MRIASFEAGGRRGFGVVEGSLVRDASAVLGVATLDAVIATGALTAVAAAAERAPALALDSLMLLPPVACRRIFCVGVNYRSHRDEMKRDDVDHPTIFVRFASSVVGHGTPIVRPAESSAFDWEGELAVVIGQAGRRIAPADAFSHIAGYSCFNDGSVRDYQRHTTQFTPGKNFDESGAFGPWLVTADEIPDPTALRLTTHVNGTLMQESTTDLMIFDIPTVIAYLSQWTELQPGDVIATGTPGGVGTARKPPIYLQVGDRVDVEISNIGVLSNVVIDG